MTIDTTRRALLVAAGLGRLGAVALAQPAERVVKIVARKFEYEPDKVTLQLGQPVVFELTSLDVLMGFSAHALGLRGDIVPGKVTTLRFTPDQVGSFEFRCDVFCGGGHEDMSGAIIVTA
jgi:cytochrome c oxidase subunit 2